MTPDEIKAVRKLLGRTQVGLAERLGVHRRTVQGWELGTVPIPVATAELLSIIAGLRPAVVEIARSDRQSGEKSDRQPGALPDPPDSLLPI